jgi:hypothetical protein
VDPNERALLESARDALGRSSHLTVRARVPMQIDPKSFMRHHERGARVKIDLSRDWDFRADFTRPLEEVRRELAVI